MRRKFCYLILIITYLLIFWSVSLNSYAGNPPPSLSTTFINPDNDNDFAPATTSGKTSPETAVKRSVKLLIDIMRVVGSGIAIIMLTYVAIKYMSAAPAEKAEFKKSATAMVVGALVLFGTSGILTIISSFATGNIKTT